jgi:hypothetical protein
MQNELIAQKKAKSGDLTMRTANESAPVHESCSELLGFGSVSRPDRPARVKRSVKAKVGEKDPPPPTFQSPTD